jgi:hypothetical protein
MVVVIFIGSSTDVETGEKAYGRRQYRLSELGCRRDGKTRMQVYRKTREVRMRDSRSRKLQMIVNSTVSESFEERVGAQKTIHSIECESSAEAEEFYLASCHFIILD